MIPSSVFTKELYENLPDGWCENRLKYVSNILPSNVDKKTYEDQKSVKLCNYVDVYYNDSIDNSLDFMVSTASDQEIKKFTLKPGDVILTKDSESPDDIGIPSVVREDIQDLVCGYHLSVLKPKEDIYGNFLFWFIYSKLSSSFFEKRANGITRFAIGMNTVGSLPVIHPSIETQKQIADFLDKETTRIDTLISKKQKQIDLLQEKRQAIITQSVTKGLNPDVKMKDSGVEWIGEIPEHWECIKHSILLRSIEQGWSPVAENKPVDSGEWGVVKISCISKGRFIQDENKSLILGTEIRKKHQIQKGDLLMSRGNTVDLVGDICLVDEIDNFLLFSDLVYRLGYQENVVDKKYIMYFHLSLIGRFQISRDASGSSMTMAKISQENIKNWIILQPPKEEQEKISNNLDLQLSRIDNLKRKVLSSIDLLKEYRSSLITHAVSGQIDITKYEVSK